MRVLAVDPGGTTGFALYDGGAQYEVHDAWDKTGQMTALMQVESFLKGSGLDVLVCESFVISMGTMKKTREGSNTAIEIIGALRWLTWKHEVKFVTQSPADAASFMTPEKLRALGWWTKGSDHARSASKHLALYLVREKQIAPERLLTPSD